MVNQLVIPALMHVSDGKTPEIGYWIAQDASGKGITTKTSQALTDLALNDLKFDKVVIKADPKNIPSNRVAEKLGYKFQGAEPDSRIGIANIWTIERL